MVQLRWSVIVVRFCRRRRSCWGVSDRQVLRLWKRSQSGGAAGLKPGLQDRALNHPWDAACRERVLELYRAKYGDFGPTLAVEYLVKCDGEVLSEETLRQWLIGAGLWSARRRGASSVA